MKRYKKEILFSSFENMTLSLFLIGYKNIGESIVVLFQDDGRTQEESEPTFSFVVDSYKSGELFLTKKILDLNGVKGLDMVCWTHPHRDHTPGIDEIVDEYFKPDMWFFMPKFYFGNLRKDLLKTESEYTEEANESLISILKKKDIANVARHTIVANGDVTIHYPILMKTEDGECRDLDFFFLTPHSSLIDKYVLKGNEISKPNDLSISFIMSVDGYDFFFGGDTENGHAELIDKELIKRMRWIKVPHHCSKGGKVICENISASFDIAASTVFASSELPVKEVQNKYVEHGRLFMTQLKNEDLEYDYGIVRFIYKFNNKDIKVTVHRYGNAHEYYNIEDK